MFNLMLLTFSEAVPFDKGDNADALRRQAEAYYPGWSEEPGFYGFAVVDTSTGEIIYMTD